MEQVRSKEVGLRKSQCAELVASRKRKLTELYYVTRFPTIMPPAAVLEQERDALEAFLDKNDIKKGRVFRDSSLPLEKEVDSMPEPEEAVAKKTKIDHAEAQDVAESSTKVEDLAERARAVVKRPSSGNPIAVGGSESSDFMLFLVPNRLPEPPQSRNPLAELYYTTQHLPLTKLLPGAHKTLTTESYQLALLEGKLAVVHARIEELKRSGKWSLRQHAKFKAPYRAKSQWDHLIEEMKWLQIDFKEERKLKIALCWEMAKAVEDYWKYGKRVCIKTRPIKHLTPVKGEPNTTTAMGETTSSTEGIEGVDGVNPVDLEKATADEEEANAVVVAKDSKKPFDSIVPRDDSQSPFKMYMDFESLNSASKEVFNLLPSLPTFTINSPYINEFDSLSLTSVTKFLSAPDLGRGWQRLVIDYDNTNYTNNPIPLKNQPPQKSDRSSSRGPLFGKELHHRKQLVRAPRPPHVKYLEYRAPTMWLPGDDIKLQKLAKEYGYNWDVVAANILPLPTNGYVANVERRSAWQCFERWYQLNPGFNLQELRGPYALMAQQWFEASGKVQQTSKRRIYPIGVAAESIQRGHRRLRWASMFDAIRKSMKKRENAPKPNQSVQRKSQLSDSSKVNVASPADLTRLKYDRDRSLSEQYQAQQRALLGLQTGGSQNAAARGNAPLNFPASAPSATPSTANNTPNNAVAATTASSRPANGPAAAGASQRSPEQLQQLYQQRQALFRHQQLQRQQQLRAAGRAGQQTVNSANGPAPVSQRGSTPPVRAAQIQTAASRAQPAVPTPMQLQQQARLLELQAQQAQSRLNNTSGSAGASSTTSTSPPAGTARSPVLATANNQQPQIQARALANNAQVQQLIDQIQANNPHMTAAQAAQTAHEQIQRYMLHFQRQNMQRRMANSNGNASGTPPVNSASPPLSSPTGTGTPQSNSGTPVSANAQLAGSPVQGLPSSSPPPP
ncbi:hypothetical protein TRVA0_030S01596 [Trichomonascus vanleenenianus]|uniref:Eaf1p n=1 Tax=Trichomonascus vanleenenianus TaxID=2268995 RepID=UPI003ECA7A44